MNVPDDWQGYWYTCPSCGGSYHASEAGCDCDDRRAEDIERSIAETLGDIAEDIEVELPVIELSHNLSESLGYHCDGDATDCQMRARQNVIAAIARAAIEHQTELEVCAYDRNAGDSWTVEIIGG